MFKGVLTKCLHLGGRTVLVSWFSRMFLKEKYRIVGNFHMGETLVNWWIFAEKTFADCSLVLPLVLLEDATPSNFAKKTFANSHKTSKFAKVFSLESFPLYGIYN